MSKMQSTGKPSFDSWGRVFSTHHLKLPMSSRHVSIPLPPHTDMTVLPHGNGRSYGDSNLNPGQAMLPTRQLDRFISFDAATGLLTCEGGVLLSDILNLAVPQGWFLPVVPGTKFVTVGGAIANDVHGKNHHLVGSFGNHVTQLELLRSDGSRRVCTPHVNTEWFAATVGGLGLTGLITWAQLQLRRIANPWLDTETIRFDSLDAFFELSQASEANHEYTVSWIDCAFTGRRLGRGIFSRANHAPAQVGMTAPLPSAREGAGRRVPLTPPLSLINPLSLKAFNTLYYHRAPSSPRRALQHYQPFFFPLDALLEWNRIYGPKGFYQYQCAVPPERALTTTRELLQTISASGMGSFLAVLKQFGAPPSRGLLSFPMPGTTLALDFPNQGPRLHRLFEALDRIVLSAGGRLYPAKDGRMSSAMFKAGYPKWQDIVPFIDPRFSSGFWRRVMEQA